MECHTGYRIPPNPVTTKIKIALAKKVTGVRELTEYSTARH